MSTSAFMQPSPTATLARPTGDIVPAAAGVTPDRLAASYEACARIVRGRARNFYHGLKLTPEPRRSAIYSIYAWMRAADDEADSAADLPERRRRLAEFRGHTERVLSDGGVPSAGDPGFWPAFAATVSSYPIDAQVFRDMLDGLDEDLEHLPYATDADLSRYCYRVAGTAGLSCLWIWGLREDADASAAHEMALRRGQAFQRTNILRDFAQDFDGDPRRVYIPTDALERQGITAEGLRAWAPAGACAAVMLEQARLTREHYRASEGLERLIDPACAPTLWAMTRIYSGLLELIEADPECVVRTKRVRLAGTRKASIAISAALRARAGWW